MALMPFDSGMHLTGSLPGSISDLLSAQKQLVIKAALNLISPETSIPPPGLFNLADDLIKAHTGLPPGFDEVMQHVNARISGESVVAALPGTGAIASGEISLDIHKLGQQTLASHPITPFRADLIARSVHDFDSYSIDGVPIQLVVVGVPDPALAPSDSGL